MISNSFIKEFKIPSQRQHGKIYSCRFQIVPSSEYGFRIFILKAPELETRKHEAHKHHILGGAFQPYICWSETIRSFEQANAIMYEWVNNYIRRVDNVPAFEELPRGVTASDLISDRYPRKHQKKQVTNNHRKQHKSRQHGLINNPRRVARSLYF